MQVHNTVSFCVAHHFVENAPTINRSFPIGFTPDVVVVRQLTYGSVTDDIGLSVIYSDLVSGGDGILGHVVAPDAITSGMTVSTSQTFKVQSNANGSSFRFTIMVPNATGQFEPNIAADGTLLMNLEFIQYRK